MSILYTRMYCISHVQTSTKLDRNTSGENYAANSFGLLSKPRCMSGRGAIQVTTQSQLGHPIIHSTPHSLWRLPAEQSVEEEEEEERPRFRAGGFPYLLKKKKYLLKLHCLYYSINSYTLLFHLFYFNSYWITNDFVTKNKKKCWTSNGLNELVSLNCSCFQKLGKETICATATKQPVSLSQSLNDKENVPYLPTDRGSFCFHSASVLLLFHWNVVLAPKRKWERKRFFGEALRARARRGEELIYCSQELRGRNKERNPKMGNWL